MAAMTQQEVILPAATVVNLMALILISFLTVPSVYSISRRFYLGQKYKAIRSVSNDYEDEDGVATEEARMAYSAIKSKYMALASTLVGLIVNIITNVYSEIQPVPSSHLVHWFTFGSWVGGYQRVVQGDRLNHLQGFSPHTGSPYRDHSRPNQEIRPWISGWRGGCRSVCLHHRCGRIAATENSWLATIQYIRRT